MHASASYPDVSLSMKMCAQREAGRTLPFPWSLAVAVHHQSHAFRARLYDEKNEAPEEEAANAWFNLTCYHPSGQPPGQVPIFRLNFRKRSFTSEDHTGFHCFTEIGKSFHNKYIRAIYTRKNKTRLK